MNQHIPFKRIALAGLGAVLMSAGASALADPPSRVARLAYVSGPVSFAPAGDNVWENAALNRPLIPGDRLWVEPGARDEIQLGGAALRMSGGTLVTLLGNDDRATQLQLSQGRLNIHVRRLRPNDVFEIDTPNLALSIREPGDYRVEVDPNGDATMVAVRRGQAEAYGDGNAYRLAAGQAYSFGGTDLRDARYARPLADEFDRWSDSRDRRIEQARSVRYVSQDLVGYEDLDDQGTWRVVPDYGNVWMPAHVGRDWAPYRDGHWSYVQPWGWTWIDDAPWGYAVSHYGRWARFNDGWGWVPGPRAASPVYAPALVAFVNIGSGSYAPRERPVAWFPLAPREVYRPSYRASPNYITNINITNTVVDRRHISRDDRRVEYANRRAVTAVPANAFAQAQPVSRSAMALPAAALAAAAIAHNAPVAPERERGHRGQGNQPPQAVMQRQALARNAPPRAAFQAPMPQQQAPQAAFAPAPRVLPQDRRGARQFGQLPPQGSAPVVQQPLPPQVQAIERDARRDHGQRDAEQRGRAQQQEQQAAIQQQAREQEQRGRMQQQEQQARMQQQAREQEQRGRMQQQEQQARMQQQAREQDERVRAQQQEQQARERQQRSHAQEQDQQARMQQQAREQEQRGRAQQHQEQLAREQEQRGRAQQQEQQARMQQQAREQEQRGRAQQQAREQEQQARMQQQAREQEQRGRAQQQQEQQARMQQQAHEQEQRGRAQQQAREQEQQARMQQQAREQEQQARARQAREQEQQARAQQQAHAQEQARAQQQAHAQEQARAQEQGRMQALAAQAAARAQAEQARAQAHQAPAAAAASAPPEKERGHGRGRDKQDDKEQQNR
ncbi:branched-chain amino acid ABC transporter substrate-binding protein [Massilia sp. R2A-15]|uniref:DUF6600 domain-containing protein n=1 Tax=Massilia sp. R2A-15 TaxID=3064278 RepID=UPI002732B6DB|nr:DUF6600 domain-containing protein [Massilia sp. R2A-15]WLI88215.1 branched-chain amino acid ABC transporter substrate-binding protein [Massilia sp. R2A-15]